MKLSSLLKFLLNPFMFGIVPDEGGGGPTQEEIDRGDVVSLDDGVKPGTTAEDEAAAAAEAERIKAEEEEAAAAAAAAAEEDDKGDKGAKADDDKGGEKKGKVIPLDRHEAILNKERAQREALAAQVADLQKGKVVQATNEDITKKEEKLATLDEEYSTLVVDGNTKEAAAKMREIRAIEREISESKTTLQVQVAEARAYERVQFDTTVERLEAAFPALNPEHEDYDKELVMEVLEMQEFYLVQKKMSPAKAMQAAVDKLVPAVTKKQEKAIEQEAKPDSDAVAKAVKEERKAGAVDKAVKTAAATPPNAARMGADSDKDGGVLTAEKVAGMSQTQFSKLTEADLAKLRGDIPA